MMVLVIQLLEIIAVIICIHRIYGVKVDFDIMTQCIIVCDMIIMELIYTLKLSNGLSSVIFILIFVYCRIKFKSSVRLTVIINILYMSILTSLQFLGYVIVAAFRIKNEMVRDILINGIVLLICMTVLPKTDLHSVALGFDTRSRLLGLIFLFVTFIISLMLLQSKIMEAVDDKRFLLVIPAVLLLIGLVQKWYQMLREVLIYEEYQKPFQKLIKDVRIRQHNFNNQIASILGTHYVYKTYDELVEKQSRYCKEILNDNKYNKLLWLGNNILAGFLYMKFQELESDGITVEYKIMVKEFRPAAKVYYLIELFGILIDNARDAAVHSDFEKVIRIDITDRCDTYVFTIRNQIPELSMATIQTWFEYGQSIKGDMRGIGLYRAKELCQELDDCDLIVENIEDGKNHWVRFTLNVRKAGDSA